MPVEKVVTLILYAKTEIGYILFKKLKSPLKGPFNFRQLLKCSVKFKKSLFFVDVLIGHLDEDTGEC